MSNNILIFSPTGGVSSQTAIHALNNAPPSTKITLAMRNPSATLPPALSTLPRVQADLTSPASILSAARTSAAKTAFIYLAFGAPDHMRGAITALKQGGVEFVVFLSSSSVRGDAHSVGAESFIAWQHAQVEVVLEEVFGKGGFVAVRPGYFAGNLLGWWFGEEKGVVRMPYPEAKFDFVAPEDIGRVCGGLVVRGRVEGGEGVVLVAGPQVISQAEAMGVVTRVVGKDVTVQGFGEGEEEEAVKYVVARLGIMEIGARQLVKEFKEVAEGAESWGNGEYEVAVANIEKYGGSKPTGIQQWVEENKGKFIGA